MMRRSVRIAVLLAAVVLVCGQAAQAQVKNVILMIADGAGFNTWNATSMYQGKWDATNGRSTQVYDGADWVHVACSTYPLNTSKVPTNNEAQDETVVYDPAKAWDPAKGYEWLSAGYTDSAAAASALSTGKKTYDHAINWSNTGQALSPTLVELARSLGKATGVVTSVQWSHATPAGLGGAQNVERNSYEEIAQQLVEKGQLDVIMGAGNPDYDDSGLPKEGNREYKYVGGEAAWKAIEEARATAGGTYQDFRPVSSRAEFEALMSGPTPAKVLGTAQVAQTLQAARAGVGPDDPPYDDPLVPGVPGLADMARGALNVLDENPHGMFLMIEGGAVDWANHKRHPGRMIEEQADFNRAVQTVVDWVEKNSNWKETLLILTADHETGLLWGKDSATKPFDPIVDNGIGKMPGVYHNVGTHTNSLVPLHARGDAASLFANLVVGSDPVRGPYITNTSVFEVIRQAMGVEMEKAEPAAEAAATR